ncbi:N-acyl homoserine lactonase family protein [Devosia sp.]|uniref:N-acyl homoserine lactonase family protein n=1 Tax=Devosia sp. TaxID=1871048 RepID=UPI002AFDD72E|nr:N-acyl homoserine lactonase family protein [Devosia sp.]
MADAYEVYALRFARESRMHSANYLGAAPAADFDEGMDYYIFLLRKGQEIILVDTGATHEAAARRNRVLRVAPDECLRAFGIQPEAIETTILTHLHWDHAGALGLFPKARFHLQATEMAYATGPAMQHSTLRLAFDGAHVAEAVAALHAGRMTLHDGDVQLRDGVWLHRIGGHSGGLQVVRVRTASGWLVLAGDAAHYWGNLRQRQAFPLFADLLETLDGFERILALAGTEARVIPGHDPQIARRFLALDGHPEVFALHDGSAGPA